MSSDPTSADSGQEPDEQPDDLAPVREGVANAHIGSVASTFGTVERPHVVEPPTFDVSAVHYDDDDSVVEVTIDVDGLRIDATLSPDQARALARQLGEGAKFADEGD